MASLQTVLRKFDARDSWESYSPELEQYFEVNGVLSDNDKVAILLTVLSPSVYKVLRDSCRPELPRLKTYAELSKLLNIHHSPLQPSIFKQRTEFYSATQSPNESVKNWLARVMRLAASCDFGHQLDTALKDNFVSGLANRRVVRRLCAENGSATLGDLVDLAEKYALLYCIETSILDVPDEVLTQIIFLLNTKERVPLGNSCHRLKSLVFEDQELLRSLDFSEKARLTTMSHIQPYFENDNTCQHILKINARHVDCVKPGHSLNNSIGKAINLVDIDIRGTLFKDIWQLGSFLEPLRHLEKLSIDWPTTTGNDINLGRRILERPFSRVIYLSVNFNWTLSGITPSTFTSFLSLCQQLRKLVMKVDCFSLPGIPRNFWNSDIRQLTNLKIVQYHGNEAIKNKQELKTVLPDPKRWMDFQLCGPADPRGFYIEKDVEVCEELLQSDRVHDFLNTTPRENFNLGWALNPEFLLKEVLRITHEDVLEDLCCLSTFVEGKLHLLKVEEAKMLLKDPRYQISYLFINHKQERGCDTHLLASAFPNVSELVLSAVTRNVETPPKDPHFQRCLRRRCSPVPEKQDDSLNLDSSFKMLVKNTPHLRHFTLNPDIIEVEDWDLDALHSISGWQSLETLDMRNIPIEDGKFLIEIGKQCKNLQKLCLRRLPFGRKYHYEDALFEMLKHCRNLRDFTLEQCGVDQVQMFALLANNVDLEKVWVISLRSEHSTANWILSIENLLRRCEKLTTVICDTSFKSEDNYNELESAVKRIQAEFRRRELQIGVYCRMPNENEEMILVKIIGVYCHLPETELFSLS